MAQSLINELKAISGCVLLIDPAAIAGGDGDAITAITDQSANGSTIALPTTKPVIKRNPYAYTGRDTIRWAGVDSTGLTVTGLTLPGNGGHTYIAVVRPTRITSGNNLAIFGAAGNAPNIYLRQAVNRLTIFQGSPKDFGPGVSGSPTSFSGAGGSYQFMNDWNIVIVRASGTNTAFRGYVNGEATTVSKSSISDVTTLYVAQVAAGTSPFYGDIGLIACYNAELSDTNVTNIAALLRAAFPNNPVPKGRAAFYFIGDSLTLGNYAATNAARWSQVALEGATAIPAAYRRSVEIGIPSGQVSGIEACWNGSGGFKTWWPSDAANPIAVVFAGTNDVGIGIQSGATVNTRLETFATTIKAYNSNTKVMVVTMLPRTGVTTVRGDLNTLLMANTTLDSGLLYAKGGGSPIDYILAIHLDSTIGDDGDNTNTTNYNADGVHLNSTGHGVLANAMDNALETLYALSSGSAPTITGVTVSDANCVEGATLALSASVTVTGGAAQTVTWEVVSGSGSVNPSTGVFDAAGLSAGAAAVVRARSVYDPYFSDTATVTAAPVEDDEGGDLLTTARLFGRGRRSRIRGRR